MSVPEPQPPPVRVDVFDALVGALRSVFGRFGLLLRAAWAPGLVFAGAVAAFYIALFRVMVPRFATLDTLPARADLLRHILLPAIPLAILMLLALDAFFVRWLQFLLDPEPPGWLAARTVRGFGRVLLWQLLAQGLFLVVAGVASAGLVMILGANAGSAPSLRLLFALIPIVLLLYAGLGVAILRCALVFPAAALDRPLGIGAAWRLMRGNTWRLAVTMIVMMIGAEVAMMIAMIVVEIAIVILAIVIALALAFLGVNPLESPALASVGLAGGAALLGLLMTALEFILIALFTAVLAIFYRQIVWERASPAVV